MKKLLFFLTVLLVISCPAEAWETSVGVGYHHRHYSSDDQIGAVSPSVSLHPVASSGLSLAGSFLVPVRNMFAVGPEISFGHGWMQAPYQTDYYTKTAGLIDTSNIMTQSIALAAKIQYFESEDYHLFLKPGFLIHRISSGATSGIDADASGFVGAEFCSDVGENYRAFLDMQAIFSPTVRGAKEYDLSYGLVFGVQRIFRSKPNVSISKPAKLEIVRSPEPVISDHVKLPDSVTPVSLPSPATPQTPIPHDPETKQQTQKAILKLGPDRKLSPESYPLMQKILDAYKKPATIKIQHRSEEKELAEEIKFWFVSKGCDKEDVITELVKKLDKPLRIIVVPK